jgi:hypothetical protein
MILGREMLDAEFEAAKPSIQRQFQNGSVRMSALALLRTRWLGRRPPPECEAAADRLMVARGREKLMRPRFIASSPIVGWVEPLRNSSAPTASLMGFAG